MMTVRNCYGIMRNNHWSFFCDGEHQLVNRVQLLVLRVISRLLLLFVDSVRHPPISFGILRLIYFVSSWKFISVTNSFSHFLHFACSLLLYLYSWQCFIGLPALLAIKLFRSVCFPLYLGIGFHIFTHSLISSSYLSFHSYNSKWTDCKL
mgnify:CR=1 FL=1